MPQGKLEKKALSPTSLAPTTLELRKRLPNNFSFDRYHLSKNDIKNLYSFMWGIKMSSPNESFDLESVSKGSKFNSHFGSVLHPGSIFANELENKSLRLYMELKIFK
ncbi:Uncharacterized protein Fot_32191 [Forsythia ovata]|uniref:Uncharacterized protein n=1 Tax=Forsythia ovata TaxID=205694 RepID=A0ABD1T740_9LAMI